MCNWGGFVLVACSATCSPCLIKQVMANLSELEFVSEKD